MSNNAPAVIDKGRYYEPSGEAAPRLGRLAVRHKHPDLDTACRLIEQQWGCKPGTVRRHADAVLATTNLDSTWRPKDLPALLNRCKPHPDFERLYLGSPMFRCYLLGLRPDPLNKDDWPVRLDPHAEPPAEKFDLLTLFEPRFERSYRRRRPDLPDQSDSSYDMSLAMFAAGAAWTVQEIADLLIAGRREHGSSRHYNKALRRDYTERTILRTLVQTARNEL